MNDAGKTEASQAILNYKPPQPDDSYRRKFRIIFWALLLLLCIGTVTGIVMPSLHRAGESSVRVTCASHLKQVGLACIMYANGHHNRLPDSLEDALTDVNAPAGIVICPATHDTPANGPDMPTDVDNFQTPGHCSYLYLGRGLELTEADLNTVLAYEPLANHANHGMNVLFGDGHVEFLPPPGVLPWIAAAKGGAVKRPISSGFTKPPAGGTGAASN